MGLFSCSSCAALREELARASEREKALRDEISHLFDLNQELTRVVSAHLDARTHLMAMRASPQPPSESAPKEPRKERRPAPWDHILIGKQHAGNPRLRAGVTPKA
jgi:hypothetical protein